MSKPKAKCYTCQRGERYFEGCSHPECPKRKNGVGCWGAVEARQDTPIEPTIEKLLDQHE